MITFGSLFSGIGGFDLGFERAGMECRWQVEIDPYCVRVLEKHWPNVKRYSDVRSFPEADTLGEWRELKVDAICGGFPCQDISHAGRKQGIDGASSGLWSEYVRVVRVLRPKLVIVENVAALLARGMDRVLGDLAEVGYDAIWNCIPAASVGAPHIRDRVFIVAWNVADAESEGRRILHAFHVGSDTGEGNSPGDSSALLANSACHGWKQGRTKSTRLQGRLDLAEFSSTVGRRQWSTEPDVGRVANGVPDRVDRLRGLGNAIVPQVAEWLGRRIVTSLSPATTAGGE